MPPAEPLKGAELAAFRAQTSPAMARIQGMEQLIYADASDAPKDDKRTASAAPPPAPAPAGKRG
ncbi:hypothetical protein D3C81_1227700 [compost metagenome]